MKVGSLFAGIGGLDLAVERAFEAETVWQLDLTGHTVRRRHWPRVRQIVRDVTKVDPLALEPVDILIGGFPCQDLSTAGTGAGLDGSRSGLYREVCRFVEALQPRYVVMENVCALLTKHRETLESAFEALGYGLTWVDIEARTVGAPHIRRRVFVVAEKGTEHRLIDAKRGGDGRHWPTPTATNPNDGEDLDNWQARSDRLVAKGSRLLSPPLGVAVRLWPTPTKGDAKSSGSRSLDGSGAHAGTSLTASVRPDREKAGEARLWATPNTIDRKGGTRRSEVEGRQSQLCHQAAPVVGQRLNPEWVETLMGFPRGWTQPMRGGDLFGRMGSLMPRAQELLKEPRWPCGRPPKEHAGLWPGHSWEPTRTLRTTGNDRRERLAWLGNAVCPQQAFGALNAWR